MGDTVNPYDACVCVQRHGKLWCPRHQGPPTMTLDRFPPFCAACYYDIQAEQNERVICKGCGKEIDPDCCGCGGAKNDPEHHSPTGYTHPFIPMGCDCFRVKPNEPNEPPK